MQNSRVINEKRGRNCSEGHIWDMGDHGSLSLSLNALDIAFV
jgi:hypothetical protein